MKVLLNGKIQLISDRPARLNDDSGHGCLYNSIALEMLKDENGIPVNEIYT